MAIDDLLDEHEQSVRVQKWLRENGSAIVLGLTFGLGLLGGWSWYQGHQVNKGKESADQFTAAETAISTNAADAGAKVNAIEDDNYRALAQLALAKSQVTAGKTADAIATLKSVDVKDAALRELVDVRLARLQTEAGAAKDAIALLNGRSTAEALEALGDAYVASNDLNAARKAYRDSLAKMDAAAASRQLVELKLTQAGGTPVVKTETKAQ